MQLSEQCVLITGGARGLGHHLSLAFAREGAQVIINYHRSAQAARALRRFGHASAWSLAGGLAMWSEPSLESADQGLAMAR